MPAASNKGLDGGDDRRPLDDEDEVDDEDDDLMDDEDDEDSLVAPAPPPTTKPTPPPSQAATLDHHHPIPVSVAVAVAVDEEDLPSSSSSSSAEEDDDAPPDLLPPPPAAAAAAAAAANNNNPNPNPCPSSSTAIVALPTPLNGSSQSLDLDIIPASAGPLSSNHTPSPKRLRTSSDDPKPTPTQPPSDDSRRLFQRLWTDDDEIELLQGFLEFTSQRSALPSHHHHDTTPFYDQIKTRLQVDFNKNQLVEKLRRLKKKYRNALKRISSSKDFAFKSPHEQATFEISRKIWSTATAEATLDDNDDASNHPLFHNGGGTAFQFDRGSSRSSSRNKRSRARSTNSVDGLLTAHLGGDHPPPSVVAAGYLPSPPPPPPPHPHHHPVLAPPTSSSTPLPSLIEDTVRSCLSPLFKEVLHCAVTNFVGVGMPLNHLPQLSSWSLGGVGGGNSEDRWRKQQILELEVYSKRLELVQEQIKLALEDLKSKGG